MKPIPILGVLLALCACDFNPKADRSAEAARQLTELYEARELRANAAGDDCLVLLILAEGRLDDAAVESIHYGTGGGAGYDGGVRQFLEDRGFRAVVYRDANRGEWLYGATTRAEAQSLNTCR